MNGAYWRIPSLAAFLLLPLLAGRVRPNDYEASRRDSQTAIERRNRTAIAAILGGVRTSMADMMFVKTEVYMHNGVAYMPHLNMDALSQRGEVVADDHDGHDDHDEEAYDPEFPPTVIPTAGKDFRGIVGELERRVRPWDDPDRPHIHTSGIELLPWYRMMTISDPTNVRAYQIGAWWLKGPKPEEALGFLKEGIANNPRAFQLPYLAGQIAAKLAKGENGETDSARTAEAWEFFDAATALMMKERPEGYDRDHPENFPGWSEYKEEDARGAVRFAVYFERDHGSRDAAIEKAVRYSEFFGGDGVLDRLARRLENED